jgi:tripartite ATP-independent transporter DctM subunit
MDSSVIGLISIALILLLIYLGMYVPMVLMLVSFLGVWAVKGDTTAAMSLLVFAASDAIASYIFAVIPLFVLMGLLVNVCGLGGDSFQVANQLFRQVRGGLGVATVAANAVFAAITGVSIASAAVFTRVAVPEMLRFGYRPRFAVGVVAGSSVLGMLIPPSILLILYALLTDQSVGDMFLAGVVPGVLLAVSYATTVVVMAHLFPRYVGGPTATTPGNSQDIVLLTPWQMLLKVLPIVVLIGLVLGGIYGGVFTATESAAVGALGALILALIKRKLNWSALWYVLVETGQITASVCFLIIAATMYSRMLGVSGVPTELGHWIGQLDASLMVIIAVFVVVLLILGTMLDAASTMLIAVPLFVPLVAAFNVNMVWFGIVATIGAEIGILTPPLGIAVYVIKSTLNDDSISLSDIFAGAFPFATVTLLILIAIILFPSLTLVLV